LVSFLVHVLAEFLKISYTLFLDETNQHKS